MSLTYGHCGAAHHNDSAVQNDKCPSVDPETPAGIQVNASVAPTYRVTPLGRRTPIVGHRSLPSRSVASPDTCRCLVQGVVMLHTQ